MATMNEMRNPPSVRQQIHDILESCRTSKGGYTNLFMENMGVQLINGWQPPPAWKKGLEDYGDLEDIKARAAVHLGRPADASRQARDAVVEDPEVIGGTLTGLRFLAVNEQGVLQMVNYEDIMQAIAAEARSERT